MEKEKKETKERVLSDAEKRRLEKFETLTGEMKEQNYIRKDLTIDLNEANKVMIILFVLVMAVSLVLFFAINPVPKLHISDMFITFGAYLISIFIHEGLHGLSWGLASKQKFKDIEFGYAAETMNPYCTCATPLEKNKYVLGAAMPLLVLGITPIVVGIAIGNFWMTLFGIIGTASAGGDIMIIKNIVSYVPSTKDVVYMDHPTEGGSVVFERG